MFSIQATDNVIKITTMEPTEIPGVWFRVTRAPHTTERRPALSKHDETKTWDRYWRQLSWTDQPATYDGLVHLCHGDKWYTLTDAGLTKIFEADAPAWIREPDSAFQDRVDELCDALQGSVMQYVEDIGTLIVTAERTVIPVGCDEAFNILQEAKVFDENGDMLSGPYDIEPLKPYRQEVYEIHKALI